MLNCLDEDEAAMYDYLQATSTLTVTPLGDNPMDNTYTIRGKGNEAKKVYSAGAARIKVIGDPYAMFAKGPKDIPL